MSKENLELLLAEREIHRQLNNYCRGLDRFDVDLWRSVWHDDATLDYESGSITGRAMDLAINMTIGHDIYAAHSHQIVNPTIVIAGDRAASETCANAILRSYPDEHGKVTDSHYRGRYLDRWSKRDGRWAIDHRQLIEELMWQQPLDEYRTGTRARRDRSDPSYAFLDSVSEGESPDRDVLLAEREIRQQLFTYCRAVDLLDVDLWKSVWHPDGSLEYDSGDLLGRAADKAIEMKLDPENWASHTHQMTNSIIKIEGDRAVSETGASAILHGHADDSRVVTSDHYRGRYLDRWSKRDGRWAIEHRHLVEDFMWRQAGSNSRTGVHARRDAADPSYALLD